MSFKTRIAVASAGVIAATAVTVPMAQAATLHPPANGQCRIDLTPQETTQMRVLAEKLRVLDPSFFQNVASDGSISDVITADSYRGFSDFLFTEEAKAQADGAVRNADQAAFK